MGIIWVCLGIIGYILGLYRDSGKENGNYYSGLYRDYKGVGLRVQGLWFRA